MPKTYLNFLRSIPTLADVSGWELLDEYEDERTCSICDGLGHGYPGAGPCPLEERGFGVWEEDRYASGVGSAWV